MTDNPIIEEIHRIREKMMAEYNGDLRAFVEALQRRTEEAARNGQKVVSFPPKPPRDTPAPKKRVG